MPPAANNNGNSRHSFQLPHTRPGLILVLGSNETGQLGLGPDIMQRTRPADVKASAQPTYLDPSLHFVDICAGGMHSIGLTSDNRVVTFGCNDEGALGRPTTATNAVQNDDDDARHLVEKKARLEAGVEEGEDVEKNKTGDNQLNESRLPSANETGGDDGCTDTIVADETRPGFVPLPMSIKIVSVSAGDSHSAALSSNGRVWLWGTFRGPSGPIGLTKPKQIALSPTPLLDYGDQSIPTSSSTGTSRSVHLTPFSRVVRIASGQDHLVCLTDEGRLYTMGCAEQGQLGRIAERFCRDGGRSGMGLLLAPTECRVRGSIRFSNCWAGGYATLAKCASTGRIYACGLNNYGQLALVSSSSAIRRPGSSAVKATPHRRRPSGFVGSGAGRRMTEDAEAMQLMAERVNAANQGTNEDDDQSLVMDVDNTQLLLEEEEEEEQDCDDLVTVDAAKVVASRAEAGKSEAALVKRQGPLIQFMLKPASGFRPDQDWRQFALATHHTLALDGSGNVYACGRTDYGRLGLTGVGSSSNASSSVSTPTLVSTSTPHPIVWIGTGEACSFAVDQSGNACSWGMGSSRQLGHGTDDDDSFQPSLMLGKQLVDRQISLIDAGGQHTLVLAHDRPVDSLSNNNGQAVPSSLMTSINNNTAPSSSVGQHQPPRASTPTPGVDCKKSVAPSSSAVVEPINNKRPCNGLGQQLMDTCSVSSNDDSSCDSQINSAKSTDGGGSSRCSSSFDAAAFFASNPFGTGSSTASAGSLPPPPLFPHDTGGGGHRRSATARGRQARRQAVTSNSQYPQQSGGAPPPRHPASSVGSTSSEPGCCLLVDAANTTTNTSLTGSINTSSPSDLINGTNGVCGE